MKHKLIIPIIAVAMLLGGCSKDKTNDTTDKKDCLVFDVEDVEAKGVSTTTATISEFGVFCFDTEQSTWETVKTTATPNKMFNQQVLLSDGVWSYDPPAYWDNYKNKLHSFFAYSPMAKGMLADDTNGNNIELTSTQDTPGVPKLKFEILNDLTSQIDLLVAREHLNLKPTDVVRIQFRHALSRIGFKAFSEIAGTYIEKIEIMGIPNKGSLSLLSPTVWTTDATSTKDFTLDYGNGVPILAPETSPIDISAPSRYLMAIPNTWTTTSTAKVKVYYRLAELSITKEFLIGATSEEWGQNRSVTYLLDLNGDPNKDLIVNKVIIEDWKMGNITNSDVGLKGENHWLRFNANGATSNLPSDIELESGSLYKIPNITPSKAASTFKEWNTALDGNGTSYNIGERVPIDNADVTLYAQWI